MLSRQTIACLAQALAGLSESAYRVILFKHLNVEPHPANVGGIVATLYGPTEEQLADLLVELLGDGRGVVRADAVRKYVYDERIEELRRRVAADGFEIRGSEVIRVAPGAEVATKLIDRLAEDLAGSDLDADSEIRRLVAQSHDDFSGSPPDLTGATTKARIALETVARRAAAELARRRSDPAPDVRWGAALLSLRQAGAVTTTEEQALAAMYTLISPGAHVPTGLSDLEWARLARTFALSATFFLLHRYQAAPP